MEMRIQYHFQNPQAISFPMVPDFAQIDEEKVKFEQFKKIWDGPLHAGQSLLPILSNLSLFTFSFITSSKLAQFQDPIPVLESTLNLLSHGVVSCSIMISFDIAMIQNRFNFGENLRKYFRKFFFQQKFLNCSNFTFSSSI